MWKIDIKMSVRHVMVAFHVDPYVLYVISRESPSFYVISFFPLLFIWNILIYFFL